MQAVHHDGSIMLHARSAKYGRLAHGLAVQVPAALVKRQKRHFVRLPTGNNSGEWQGMYSTNHKRVFFHCRYTCRPGLQRRGVGRPGHGGSAGGCSRCHRRSCSNSQVRQLACERRQLCARAALTHLLVTLRRVAQAIKVLAHMHCAITPASVVSVVHLSHDTPVHQMLTPSFYARIRGLINEADT